MKVELVEWDDKDIGSIKRAERTIVKLKKRGYNLTNERRSYYGNCSTFKLKEDVIDWKTNKKKMIWLKKKRKVSWQDRFDLNVLLCVVLPKWTG